MKSLSANIATTATTATTATNSLQLGGVAANQYVLTTDPRMTDARNPLGGSGNYIQNTTTPQPSSNFNVSGTGTVSIFDALTQFNLGGNRVLSNAGSNNLFAGIGAGVNNTTGNYNAFFGRSAGFSSTTSIDNAFFGTSAGVNYTTGTNDQPGRPIFVLLQFIGSFAVRM